MTYYAQRKSIKNGEAQPATNKYGTRRAMERQYHLFCANACDGDESQFEVDAIEWGTLEHGVIERKCYVSEAQAQETNTEEEAPAEG